MDDEAKELLTTIGKKGWKLLLIQNLCQNSIFLLQVLPYLLAIKYSVPSLYISNTTFSSDLIGLESSLRYAI